MLLKFYAFEPILGVGTIQKEYMDFFREFFAFAAEDLLDELDQRNDVYSLSESILESQMNLRNKFLVFVKLKINNNTFPNIGKYLINKVLINQL